MTPAAIHSPEKTEEQEEEAETGTGRKEGQKRRKRLEAGRDSCSRARGSWWGRGVGRQQWGQNASLHQPSPGTRGQSR